MEEREAPRGAFPRARVYASGPALGDAATPALLRESFLRGGERERKKKRRRRAPPGKLRTRGAHKGAVQVPLPSLVRLPAEFGLSARSAGCWPGVVIAPRQVRA